MSGHCYFGYMKILGDFSNWDCTFKHRNYYGALSRPHSCVRAIFVGLEKYDTLQTHSSWLDSICSLELVISLADLVGWSWLLSL